MSTLSGRGIVDVRYRRTGEKAGRGVGNRSGRDARALGGKVAKL